MSVAERIRERKKLEKKYSVTAQDLDIDNR